MKSRLHHLLFILILGLTLGGCASFDTSFDASLEQGRSLTKIRRFFVVSNDNDNHGIDQQIVEALKARGLEAATGPLTMMPDNNQAVITYQDHWSWDFGDHLVFLKLAVRDPFAEQSYATATFTARVPLRETTPGIVGQLVGRLLENHPTTQHKAESLDKDPTTAPTAKKHARPAG